MPAEFNWEDPLDLESQLTEDERMIRDRRGPSAMTSWRHG